MSIFRAYDVRGIYPAEINEEIAYKTGRAFVDFLKAKTILVSYDMRNGSVSLKDALARGITDQGADAVVVKGLCSTPKGYFAGCLAGADGSMLVNASHNPGIYNGFKLTRKGAVPVSGETGIKEIEKLVLENRFSKPERRGSVKETDVTKEYIDHILMLAGTGRIKPLKIAVDAGNGMGGREMEHVLDRTPLDVVKMYFEPDGRFPNHEANPLIEENLRDVRKRVLEEGADLGVAFDGDADRVFFVDDKGEIVPSSFITCIIAEDILRKNPGGKIVYDIRSSWIVKETIERLGGKPIMWRVGHSFIKECMRRENAVFCGEFSGHYYFRDNFYAESAVAAVLKIVQIMSGKGKKLSELADPLRKYFATGEINSEVEDKDGKMKELAEIYKNGKSCRMDGVRVDFEDWWFIARPSNTEPLLRLCVEAKTEELMEEKRDEVLEIIRR